MRLHLLLHAAFALQVIAQQPHIAAIGAPEDVEKVAGDRHCPDKAVDRDIAEHAGDQVALRGTDELRAGSAVAAHVVDIK